MIRQGRAAAVYCLCWYVPTVAVVTPRRFQRKSNHLESGAFSVAEKLSRSCDLGRLLHLRPGQGHRPGREQEQHSKEFAAF